MPSPSAPIALDCTNCGARLSVDGSARRVPCGYCRAEVLLPESIWLEFHPPPAQPPPRTEPSGIGIPRSAIVLAVVIGATTLVGGAIAVIGAVVGVARVVPKPIPLNPTAAASEPCNGRRAACSADGKAELFCGTDDKMSVGGSCKGPNGCRAAVDGKTIRCDATLADRGDPCAVADDACSTAHDAELRCEAGHFAVVATCKGPDGCTLTPAGQGYTLSCDDHVAVAGDPCFDAQRTACSADKKALLTCTAQHFVVDHACKHGCVAKKVVGTGDTEMSCK